MAGVLGSGVPMAMDERGYLRRCFPRLAPSGRSFRFVPSRRLHRLVPSGRLRRFAPSYLGTVTSPTLV